MHKRGDKLSLQLVKTEESRDGGQPQTLEEVDVLLWAVGRSANSEAMGLDKAGVQLDDHGHIIVDEYQNTSSLSTYALGDVTGKKLLTPGGCVLCPRVVC